MGEGERHCWPTLLANEGGLSEISKFTTEGSAGHEGETGTSTKGGGMLITRVWAMPSKWTFTIPPIRDLLKNYGVGSGWIDPFCGQASPAEYRNDLNPDNTHAQYHLEALDFCHLKNWDIVGALFDPPYSASQVALSYK